MEGGEIDYSTITSVIKEFSYTWDIHVKDLFTDHDITSTTFHHPDHETGVWSLEMVGFHDNHGELCVRLGIRLHKGTTHRSGRARFSITGTEFQSSDAFSDFEGLEAGQMSSVTYNLPLQVITKWANGKVEDQNLVVNLHMWLLLPSITAPMTNVKSEEDHQVIKKLEREDLWEENVKNGWMADVTIRCLIEGIRQGNTYHHDRVTWSGQSENQIPSTKIAQEVIENGTSQFVNYSQINLQPRESSSGLLSRRNSPSKIPRRSPSSKGLSPNRGINAVRAGFLSAREAESLGLGRLTRRAMPDGDTFSLADEVMLNDDRSQCSPSTSDLTRGWVVDPFGPSDVSHVLHKNDRRNIDSPLPLVFHENNFVEFKVHRSLLGFRSPVFRQMLADDSLDFIEVMDTDAMVLEEILRFLYTGAVSKDAMPSMVESLLEASSKYDILHLKAQCEEIAISTLKPENAGSLYVLSHRARAATLKEGIHKYCLREFREIFRTPEFRQFRAEHSTLANEFLMNIFSRSSTSQI